MFEHFGSRERTLFVDVTDDDKGYVARLGELHDPRGALFDLREAADSRFDGFGSDGLDGVDDHDVGFELLDLLQDALERGLRRDIEVLRIPRKAFGAQFELADGLFAGSVESLPLALLHKHLKRESGFADTRFATQKHKASRHETSSQDAIQFAVMQVDTHLVGSDDVLEAFGKSGFACQTARADRPLR